jgi:hypothetical protein
MSANVDLPPPARGGDGSSFLPGRGPAPSLLTNALAAAGRALLALVVRVDIGKMAGIETHIADAGQIMRWLTTAVMNVELLVTWLVVWPSLHIGMLLVSRFVFGQSHGSPQILIAVEVFLGLMLAFAIVRVPMSLWQLTRVAKAIGAARDAGSPPPHWTQRPGLAMRLATPTDWDLVLGIVLIAALEILGRLSAGH